jgi:glycosyltransferase involved in cell wall biosynthesis
MTNEEWDKNRILFSEKFKSNLPLKIAKTEKDKLKILLSCLSFKTFTGSEVYIYELAKNLVKKGHNVSVLSEIGGPLTEMAKKQGIKVFSFQEPPGYKRGDGKWNIQTPNGVEQSKDGMLYKVSETNFDLIHVQHEPITKFIIQLYPQEEKIATIHSEVIDLEKPVIHESIKKYIAIRPEIKKFIEESYDISSDKIEVIYNPVDELRFKPNNKKEKDYVLFVGTIDYLRENTIRDLIQYTKDNLLELWLVGENKSEYLNEIVQNPHVKWFPPIWNTEKYISEARETAGILLGRTTIESWMCGKKSWIYNIDKSGFILDKSLQSPPQDINKFYGSTVCEKLVDSYLNIINETSN